MDSRHIKRDLRKQAIAARAALIARIDVTAAALAVRDRFLDLFDPKPGTVVSAFWPVGEEFNIRPLIEALHARGCVCALPVVTVKHMPLTFRVWEPGMSFIVSSFGIPEPGPDRAPVTPDISIVPLLAFDDEGYRLGYGGGYYDRTIEQLRMLRRDPPYLTVGVAFAGQRMEHLPRERFDQPLDWILTEQGAHEFRAPDDDFVKAVV
jgi:5-formyltetrahydrofolate cyclo-ligase